MDAIWIIGLYFIALAMVATAGAWIDQHWLQPPNWKEVEMDFVNTLGQILPEDWLVHDPWMGMDCLLECPHGYAVEQDGRCPEGCVSPLLDMGMI